MGSSQRDICLTYFTEISENKWKCRCGRELTQKKGSGWTNLLNHLKSQHPNYSDDASQLKLSTFMPKNKMADTVFGWIEWICTDLLPFTFVEKEMSRKYSNLDNISYKTLMKYL